MIAGFDVSPWMATMTSPLSVGIRLWSHDSDIDPRPFGNFSCTERNSISISTSSAGIVLQNWKQKIGNKSNKIQCKIRKIIYINQKRNYSMFRNNFNIFGAARFCYWFWRNLLFKWFSFLFVTLDFGGMRREEEFWFVTYLF